MVQPAALSICARLSPALLIEYDVEAARVLCVAKEVTFMPALARVDLTHLATVSLLTAL